jgi:hypothetical protein
VGWTAAMGAREALGKAGNSKIRVHFGVQVHSWKYHDSCEMDWFSWRSVGCVQRAFIMT